MKYLGLNEEKQQSSTDLVWNTSKRIQMFYVNHNDYCSLKLK